MSSPEYSLVPESRSYLNLDRLPQQYAELIDVRVLDEIFRELPPIGNWTFQRLIERLSLNGGAFLHVGGDRCRSLALYALGLETERPTPLHYVNVHISEPAPLVYRALPAVEYHQKHLNRHPEILPADINWFKLLGKYKPWPWQFDGVLVEPDYLPGANGERISSEEVLALMETINCFYLKPEGLLFARGLKMEKDLERDPFFKHLFSTLPSAVFAHRSEMVRPDQYLREDTVSLAFQNHKEGSAFIIPSPASNEPKEQTWRQPQSSPFSRN